MKYISCLDFEKVGKQLKTMIDMEVGEKEGKYFSIKPTLDLNKQFNLIYGNRSSGKTVAVLCHVVREAIFKGRMFCYLRTHENALNVVRRGVFDTAARLLKKDKSSPFTISYDNGGQYVVRWDDGNDINTMVIGYCVSLNAVEQFKSNASLEMCRNIVYEECQPEGGINDVDIARMLPSLYSSIDRNRRDTSLFALANLIGGAVPLSNVFGLTRTDIDNYHRMPAGVMVPSNEEVSLTKVFLDIPVEKTSLSAFRGNRYVEEAGLNKSYRNEGVAELIYPLPVNRTCLYVFLAEKPFYGYENANFSNRKIVSFEQYYRKVKKVLDGHDYQSFTLKYPTAIHQQLAEDYYHEIDNDHIIGDMYNDYVQMKLPHFTTTLRLVDKPLSPQKVNPLEDYIYISRDEPEELDEDVLYIAEDTLTKRRLDHKQLPVKMVNNFNSRNVVFDSIQAYEDFTNYVE